MIVSYSKYFVFLHLEKTGGTSVTNSLRPYMKNYDLIMDDWKKFFFNQEGDAIEQHVYAHTVEKFLNESWIDFNKFSLVRNPVEIFKSSYMFSKNVYELYFKNSNDIRNIPPEGSIKAYAYSEKTGYGVDGFIDYMISTQCGTTMPQSDRLGSMLYDGLIVDLSVLDRSWNSITHYLGFENHIPLSKDNVTNSSVIDISSLSEQKIKKHLEKDYELIPKITGVNW